MEKPMKKKKVTQPTHLLCIKILGIILDTTYDESLKLLIGIITAIQLQAMHASIGGEHIGLVEIHLGLLLA